MRRSIFIAIVGLLLCAPTHAAEGRIPLFEPTVIDGRATCVPSDGPPVVLCSPVSGRYVVTNDIVGESDGDSVIRVIGTGVEQVDIDLNGFTLTGVASGTRIVWATNVRTFAVRNGTTVAAPTSPSNGVHVNWDPTLDPPAAQSERVLIEDMTILGGANGLAIFSIKNFTIRNNAILGANPGHGIRLNGLESQGTISGNLIRGSSQHGIRLLASESGTVGVPSVVIERNQLEDNASNGIHVAPGDGGLVIVADNAVKDSGFRGIFVNRTSSCRISGNTVHNSGAADPARGFGIQISNDARSCLVLNNTSSANHNAGIRVVGDMNHIMGNVLTLNGTHGLFFDAAPPEPLEVGDGIPNGNTFGDNTARGSGGSLSCNQKSTAGCPGLCAPDYCDEGTNNSSFGTNLAPGPTPG